MAATVLDEAMSEKPESMIKRVEFLALVATAVPLLIATFNVLVLVDYDSTVLPVVVRNLDIVNVAFSVFLNSFSFLPLALAVYLADPDVDLGALIPGPHLLALLAHLMATILFFPLSAVVATIVFLVQSMGLVSLVAKTRGMVKEGVLNGESGIWRWFVHPSAGLVVRASGGIILAAFILFASFVETARWIPLERVEVKDVAYVGWVLQAGDHDLTLLERGSRKPFIFRQDDVVRRTICQEPEKSRSRDVFSRTIPSLIFNGVNLPARLPNC
ncbi:hypothetical protein AB0425_19085 [Actinosynnema sp. NPDC051121]